VTNTSRPLINQAPWVVNVALDYNNEVGTSARLAWNVNGKTVRYAGSFGVDDGYLQSRHSLDFTISQKFLEHWTAKLSAENILNDDYLTTVGKDPDGDIWNQYRTGATFGLGIGYEL
jgi:outer membrane receptor protein involved in Fe transport